MEPRLKAGLWVRAQVRRCNGAGRPALVMRRGDEDAGAVVLKVVMGEGRARLYSQTTAADGGMAWHAPLGPGPLPESETDSYIDRQARFDPDLWAVEITDPSGAWRPDGAFLDDDD